MEIKVRAKQPNSKMCLVCGLKNKTGLQTSFYELENNKIMAVFTPRAEHQGYPGRLHGGIISAILDETIGRAIMISHSREIWGVTLEITTRFKKPVPLTEEVRVLAWTTKETGRYFEGTGEVILPDGTIAAKGHGRYLKLPIDKIADFDVAAQEWGVVPSADDPEQITL